MHHDSASPSLALHHIALPSDRQQRGWCHSISHPGGDRHVLRMWDRPASHSHVCSPPVTLSRCITVPHAYCRTFTYAVAIRHIACVQYSATCVLLYVGTHNHKTNQSHVPAFVRGTDGTPVHHGIVERAFDRLRATIQRYVLDKQEDRACVLHSQSACIPCTVSRVCMAHPPSMH